MWPLLLFVFAYTAEFYCIFTETEHQLWTLYQWESRTNQTEQEKTVICSFLISKCLEYQHGACPDPVSSQCSSCGKGSSAHMFAVVHCCVSPLISSSELSVWWSYSEEGFHLISVVFLFFSFLCHNFDIFRESTQDLPQKYKYFPNHRPLMCINIMRFLNLCDFSCIFQTF